jgi:hypothetical protein
MSARTINSQLLAVVTVAILVGACGPGASPASPSQSPPALAVATDAAAAAPERTYVSGTMGCDAVKETPIEGVEHLVRLTFDCPFEMSDPRVTGSELKDCDEGFYDLADLPGGVGIWNTCSGVLTGQGGSWKMVSAYGSEFMKSGTLRVSGANIYQGQGAFEGLRFVALFSASPELAGLYGDGYHVAGWIEPAE